MKRLEQSEQHQHKMHVTWRGVLCMSYLRCLLCFVVLVSVSVCACAEDTPLSHSQMCEK